MPRANRGIGLELTRQLLEVSSNTVITACRSPSKADALQALSHSAKGTLHIVQASLEVTDRDSVRAVAAEVAPLVGEHGIDYLINNVGAVRRSAILCIPIVHLFASVR